MGKKKVTERKLRIVKKNNGCSCNDCALFDKSLNQPCPKKECYLNIDEIYEEVKIYENQLTLF